MLFQLRNASLQACIALLTEEVCMIGNINNTYFVNNALMPRALGNSSVVVRGKYANDFLGNPKRQENFHGMHSGLSIS